MKCVLDQKYLHIAVLMMSSFGMISGSDWSDQLANCLFSFLIFSVHIILHEQLFWIT